MRFPSILYTTTETGRATVPLDTPVHVPCNLQHVAGRGEGLDAWARNTGLATCQAWLQLHAPGRHALSFVIYVGCSSAHHLQLALHPLGCSGVGANHAQRTHALAIPAPKQEDSGYVGMACSKSVTTQHAVRRLVQATHAERRVAAKCGQFSAAPAAAMQRAPGPITAAACRPHSWLSSRAAAAVIP